MTLGGAAQLTAAHWCLLLPERTEFGPHSLQLHSPSGIFVFFLLYAVITDKKQLKSTIAGADV